MISAILFFFGLFIGSFLLVVIERLPRGESVIYGRSHCDMCGHTLAWYDLLPLISYLMLGGKCRYCHKGYGFQYPFVELVTGFTFASLPIFFSSLSIDKLVLMGIILCGLVVIFFCDLFYGIIPDIVSIIIGITSIFFVGFSSMLIQHFLAGLGAFIFFFALYIGTRRRGMGLGDVKFAFVMGLLLGFPLIVMGLYLAFLTGAVIAIILIVSKKKHFQKDTISFGPFLVLGTYCSLIGGITLWNFLIKLLFHM